jgi:hypothetical protein
VYFRASRLALVSLAALENFDLIRLRHLSPMPLSEEPENRILAMARVKTPEQRQGYD